MNNKMNYKLKTILITLSTLALVACNGGGGSSSGGDTPSPTPSPSPSPTPIIAVQPLEITQNIIPSLNKVGSHQVWYMIVKNTNAEEIKLLGGPSSEFFAFVYTAIESNPINPTKYAMKYDNAISGVESDCLNIINKKNVLAAGQSCAYKFDAQWGGNITAETNFKFAMKYDFVINHNGRSQGFSEDAGCDGSKYTCLPNNQNLQFNLMNLSHQANDLNGYTAMTNNLGGNIISMDGSTYWDASVANTANVYTINYNSSTNTYTKTLANTYAGGQFGGGFSALNTNGSSYYWNMLNQTGIMTNLYNLAQYGWGFTYGLNGNLYADNPTFLTSAYLLNQNGINSTVTQLTTIGREATYGVNTNGSLWTYSDVYPGNMYCYDATNNYAKTTMNLNGIEFDSMMFRNATPNNYYLNMVNSTDYFDINYNNQMNVNLNYLIDINNCQVNKSQYLVKIVSINQQFGITYADDYNFYIESVNQFSNGLNGGN